MDHKKINYSVAAGIFLASLIVYLKTISPTVVFWDVGEFCAAAFSLQVPHPPGAPLFLLIARLFSMIPFVQDIAVRMHVISALGSSTACALLYLIIVDMMVMLRGIPSVAFDRISVYGAAAIGALSLAFASTFWFNAVEAEVYGLSMAFVGLIILLGLRWYERADKDSGDRYILLIAYIIGLAVGVHLLAILTLFPVMLFWYFRYNNKFGWKSFIKFGLVSLLIFLIVYPGIVTILPSLLDGEFRIGRTAVSNTAISLIPVVLIIGAIYGIYRSIIKRNRTLNIALLSFLLIILGYSTYTLVFIRANAHPPMNENDPSTMERLVSYLNREQYGSTPILNRRWEIDPVKKQYQRMYSSDLDYMLRYQIVHMYFRYFGWNYIGSAGDFRNAGVDWKQFYMVPFLFGLLGLYYQWRKQPNMALPMTVTFIIMGVILALYQNQQEPQPRERDYFYVGSFFVFSLWIAYGVLTLMEFARTRIKHGRSARQTAYGILIFAFVFVPFNMFRTNYRQANRSGNYMPWDYSYNLLQSCEPDAILITNGDNDTFPLWYLQDVEGIRRDIRIVNLSLANARWYIRQLKNETPYGAKKVPISMADVEIENIKPVQFESRWMTLPVSPSVVQKLRAEGGNAVSLIDTSVTNSGVLRFFMPSTMQYGKYKFIRSQDILLYDIVHTSKWQRPIYFAMTVSNENKIGLHNCSQMTGLAFKLVPQMTQNYWMNLDENSVKKNIFTDIGQPSKEPAYGFLWRGFQDSTTYYDEDTRQLIMANYRNLFISYALYCMNVKKETQLVPAILDRMEKVIPRRSVRMDYRIKYDLASFYAKAGDSMHSDEFIDEVIGEAREIINKPVDENLSQYNPFMILYYCYLEKGNYSDAQELLPKLKSAYQSQQGIDNLIKRLQDQIDVKKGGKAAR